MSLGEAERRRRHLMAALARALARRKRSGTSVGIATDPGRLLCKSPHTASCWVHRGSDPFSAQPLDPSIVGVGSPLLWAEHHSHILWKAS